MSDKWLVWSNEHRAWWGPGHHGYTTDTDRAGRYTYADAAMICANANIVLRDPPNELMVLAPVPASLYVTSYPEIRESTEDDFASMKLQLRCPSCGLLGDLIVKTEEGLQQ